MNHIRNTRAGLKESPSNYVFNIEFVLKRMISTLYVIGIFIFYCSSKNGFIMQKFSLLLQQNQKVLQ